MKTRTTKESGIIKTASWVEVVCSKVVCITLWDHAFLSAFPTGLATAQGQMSLIVFSVLCSQ